VARDLKKTFLVCNMYPQHFHDPRRARQVLDYVGGRIVEASRRPADPARSASTRSAPWRPGRRASDDIAAWKRSGADRLLRDLETYLSGLPAQVLRGRRRADREDRGDGHLGGPGPPAAAGGPGAARGVPRQLDRNIAELERRFDDAVAEAMRDVAPLRMRIRGLALQPFASEEGARRSRPWRRSSSSPRGSGASSRSPASWHRVSSARASPTVVERLQPSCRSASTR
jgi:hypothetical protein